MRKSRVRSPPGANFFFYIKIILNKNKTERKNIFLVYFLFLLFTKFFKEIDKKKLMNFKYKIILDNINFSMALIFEYKLNENS